MENLLENMMAILFVAAFTGMGTLIFVCYIMCLIFICCKNEDNKKNKEYEKYSITVTTHNTNIKDVEKQSKTVNEDTVVADDKFNRKKIFIQPHVPFTA